MLNIPSLGIVPMNTKILFGLTLVAVLAMAVASPAVADAITGIKKTEIKVKNDEIKKLKFQLDDKVPKHPFGGYALFTDDGSVIAITSHEGFFDSTGQQAPTTSQVALQVGAIAAVCNVTDVACGNEWHAHLVNPEPETLCDEVGGIAKVGELTYNQPTDKLKIAGKNILASGIDLGTEGFVGAISGQLMDFTVGEPGGSAAFNLVPVNATGLPIENAGQLAAVCIVPSA
jgi:hypothetical protein